MRKGLVWSIAVVLLTLAGCGSPSSSVGAPQSSATVSSPSTKPPTTTTSAVTGRLRITQHQTFAPGEGCSIAQTDTALQLPVPDLFAFREPYEDCGLDFSLEMVGDVPSQGRTCFAEANNAGRTAELSAYEAGATPGSPDFIVYRTNADRSVDVFLPNLGRESDGPWRHYGCSGLRPDAAQGFTLDGCTDPIEIDP